MSDSNRSVLPAPLLAAAIGGDVALGGGLVVASFVLELGDLARIAGYGLLVAGLLTGSYALFSRGQRST
ncbi:MAG: hypothetical protein H6983_06915 [Ectothiorhodospiraceae bacterium]|nr:hypothetical protein [Chromatiales bacterium]MCP5153877.1 hypothetical protein [Ectothiorhodospiraceae bacterium]